MSVELEGTTRRTFLQGAITAGVVSSLPAVAKAATADAPFRPNILYIHSHDSGRYLRQYGHDVPTPNLAKLATEGVLFRNTFSAAPTCSPSRASLLTGECAHSNGMLGLAHLGWMLNDYNKVIIHTLKKAGYNSVLAGLQHIAPKDKIDLIGYDKIITPKSVHAVDVAPVAIDYLKSKPQGPFFLDCGFFETHRTFDRDVTKDNADYIMPPAGLPDTPETREDMAGFHGSARQLDNAVGDIMAALEEAGLAENTLVISTTDHGVSFPEMKCNLYDRGWAVSLVMRGPREFKPGTVCNAMISHLDVFPTICEYIGVDKPEWLQGKSFLPVLRGQQKEINEEIFAEVTYHAAYEPKRCVRTARYKYIRRYDGRKTAVLPNCDDGDSKQLWLDNGWQTNPLYHEEEMYDLIFDPLEKNDLSKDPAHQQTLEEMRGRLLAWQKRTNDPILKGPVDLPSGYRSANVNDVYLQNKKKFVTNGKGTADAE